MTGHFRTTQCNRELFAATFFLSLQTRKWALPRKCSHMTIPFSTFAGFSEAELAGMAPEVRPITKFQFLTYYP
jgi:hypothetical protein